MKIVIDIDQKSFSWLQSLIENSYNNTRKGVVSPHLFDSIPHIEAWHKVLSNPDQFEYVESVASTEYPPSSAKKKPSSKKSASALKKAQLQKKKEREAEEVYTCSHHKTYHGLRSPRTDCDECWQLYAIRNGVEQAKLSRTLARRKWARER